MDDIDLADVTLLLAQLEVARWTEKAYYSEEAVEGSHLWGNAAELVEEGIDGRIVEKLSAHSR